MTLQGFDASSFQNSPVWPQVKGDPNGQFAIFRSAIGATGLDSMFMSDVRGAESIGIPVLSYGVAYPATSNAIAEADAICADADKAGGLHGLFLDVENAGVLSTMNKADLTQFILDWASRVQSHGYVPGAYLNFDYLVHRVDVPKLKHLMLWQAEYGVLKPTVVGDWQPTFWQHTSSSHVNGIQGNVDLDTFYGTMDDLLKLSSPSPSGNADAKPTPAPNQSRTPSQGVITLQVTAGKVKVNGHDVDTLVENNTNYVPWTVFEQIPGFQKKFVNGEWVFTFPVVDGAKVKDLLTQAENMLGE